MTTRRDTERYLLDPEITDARIARQWEAVDRSFVPARPKRWPSFALAGVGVAAIAVAVLWARGPRERGAIEGAVLESVGGHTMTLSDGSRVEIGPNARVRVGSLASQHIELVLEKGGARFDVPHVSDRRFIVHVGSFDVIDIGTRFGVEIASEGTVTVVVEEGRVELRRRDASDPPRFIDAGERWSTGEPAHAAQNAAPDSSPAEIETTDSPAPSATPSAMSASPRTASVPSAAIPTGKDLLEAAERARRDGHPREAAATFDRLRRHYRTDARAGLAAFELGRLRLDQLGDPAGAAEAFRDAIALSPLAPFREDAEARLVDALDASGDAAHCREARAAYLNRYPRGLHASRITSRCARLP